MEQTKEEALLHLEEMYNKAKQGIIEDCPIMIFQSVLMGGGYHISSLARELSIERITDYKQFANEIFDEHFAITNK